jgi:hypothetical protein
VTGLREPEVKSASTANKGGKAIEKDWMQTQPAETPFQGLSDFSMQIKGLQTPCRLRGEKLREKSSNLTDCRHNRHTSSEIPCKGMEPLL